MNSGESGGPYRGSTRWGSILRPGRWGWRTGLAGSAVFAALVVGWTGAMATFLWLSGASTPLPHQLPETASLEDALWHLGTAAILAFAAGRRTSYWAAPVMALGIDLDHLGALWGWVGLHRPAHDLVFLVVATLVLYRLVGRPAALTAAGALLEHLAVDGGTFPLLSPFSRSYYALSYGLEIALLVAAGVLLMVAVRPLRAISTPRWGVRLLLTVGVLALLLAFAQPWIQGFNGN